MKPPPRSKSVMHGGLCPPPTLSPTDKENLDLTTAMAPTDNTSQKLDGSPFDCYTFTEDDVHNKRPSSLRVGHKRVKHSVSSSAVDKPLTHPTEPKSPNMCILKEPNAALSSHPQLTDTTTIRGGKQQNQSKKKPVKCSHAARVQRKGKFNSCLRNAVAAGASSTTTATTSTTTITTAGGEASVQGDSKRLLSVQMGDDEQVGTNMKGSQGDSSKQEGFDNLVTDLISQCSAGSSSAEHQTGGTGKQTPDILSSLTMGSVYQESQIMGRQPLGRFYTQGNVESGGYKPGSDELSHGSHTTAVDRGSSADSTPIAGVPGNPKTDPIPTLAQASASGSPSGSSTSACQCEVVVENEVLKKTMCNSSTSTCEQHGLKRSKRRQRGRGGREVREGRQEAEGERKCDPNDSWIQTSSQPLSCNHTRELESSQSDHISCSLPDRSQEERESKPSRSGTGTRTVVRGRKRQRGGGGGRTTASGEFAGRMTRSRAAALMKSNVEAEMEEALPSSSDSRNNMHLPPTKKQKPRQGGPFSPVEPTAQCNESDTLVNTLGCYESVTETPSLSAASGAGGEVAVLTKPCKSSSPSPPFAQCSSSQASQSQPHCQASMKMVCLHGFT